MAGTRPVRVAARGWGHRHAGRRAWAIRGLDLDVGPGERVLLLGASGAGKSTLLTGLAGLLDAQDSGESEGALTLDGVPAGAARDRAGLVLQDPEAGLVMGRVGDDVAFGPENHAVPHEQIWPLVGQALDVVGFPYGLEHPTAALSGGEKQRLALAGVLAVRPGLLLLDEPTGNLDPAGAALVRDAVVRALGGTGATLVVVEHRVELWQDVVDRVVVLAADGVLADGSPGDVLQARHATLAAAGVWLPGAPPVPRRRRATRPPEPAGAPPPRVVALRADGVSARHPGAPVDAVTRTDVVLAPGRTTAVVGPNGSGKSTLLTLLAGLAAPRTGAVTVPGVAAPLHRLRARELARRVGTVFQQPEHQFVRSTVRDELLVAPRVLGRPGPASGARADVLLEQLGLTALAAANPFTLSGGQKRRLSVATALSAAPPVLLLDEPTFGQDALTWAALVELLDEVRDEGAAVVAVSHDVAFVDAVADEVLEAEAGRFTPVTRPVPLPPSPRAAAR